MDSIFSAFKVKKELLLLKALSYYQYHRYEPPVGPVASFFRDIFTEYNRLLGNEYVPPPRERLCIETIRRCNLKCRFCPSIELEAGDVVLGYREFVHIVEAATEAGWHRFSLTPIIGEPFLDPGFFKKLEYLECHPQVDSFFFNTNWTVPNRNLITEVLEFRKLNSILISIYGHDEASFLKITQSNRRLYRMLLDNLNSLNELAVNGNATFELAWRSDFNFRDDGCETSELIEIVNQIRTTYKKRVPTCYWFHNKSNLLNDELIGDLNIRFIENDKIKKNGPCALLFSKNIVMLDGNVVPCTCGDKIGSLSLGRFGEKPFGDFLSSRDEAFRQLVSDQTSGKFADICKQCTDYQSIFSSPRPFNPFSRSILKRTRQDFWDAI